ncbi:MAG: hypothetical protein ACP5E3_19925 [Bacteroidales bacterium]
MKSKFIYVSIFAVAMAFFESSVVIYLRELMYPEGFDFPLAPISPDLALTEILREAATLIMLVMIGVLAAKTIAEGFAWFLYSFAIWDIFYYVFLKLLIGWPESFLTWDILFLIPVTWTGPVLTPVLVSLLMILLAIILIFYSTKNVQVKIKPLEWTGLIGGSLILILSFTWDYSTFILKEYSLSEIFTVPDKTSLYDYAIGYIPVKFPWSIYFTGIIIILAVILLMWKRYRKEQLSS